MMRKRFNNTLRALVLVLCAGLTTVGFGAGLTTQMENLFNSMSNKTPSTFVGNAAGTGVIGFGSYTLKNHISSGVNIVSWTLPSFSAGCGGIDWYKGSISFINKDDFQQLLRDIASNAAGAAIGYAFNMALDAMCPSCLKVMNTLSEKIRGITSKMSDSCQVGMNLVNAVTESGLAKKLDIKKRMQAVGRGTDFLFETLGFNTEKPGSEYTPNPDPEQKCAVPVNTLWCLMRNQNVPGAFEGASATDYELAEALMGLVGTVIINDLADYEKTGGGTVKSTDIRKVRGDLRMIDIMKGGNDVLVVSCEGSYDPHGCMDAKPKRITLKGMEQYLYDILLGPDGSGQTSGIVYRFIFKPKEKMSAAEENLFRKLPYGVGEMIRTLANVQPEIVVGFVSQLVPKLAHEMVIRMVDDMLVAVKTAADAGNEPYKELLEKMVKEGVEKLRAERLNLRVKYGDPAKVIKDYETYLSVARGADYGLSIGGQGR